MVRVFDKVHALAATMAGETTGVVVVLSPAGLVGVTAGDSAAWLVTRTAIDDLTAAQRRARLGSGCVAPFSFTRDRLCGRLVVGTDGLFKYATAEKIAEMVRAADLADAAKGLLELARLPGGGFQDEVAAVVVERVAGPVLNILKP